MLDLAFLLLGWLLGILSSLLSGLALFWLEGQRIRRNELLQRKETNLRVALNWAKSDKKISLRGYTFVGTDLSGVDLSGADLVASDFSHASLNGARFHNAKLSRTSFIRANLKGVDFRFADLTQADFSHADIGSANFDNANLNGTKFIKSKGIYENSSLLLSVVDEMTELPSEKLKELLEFQNLVKNHPQQLIDLLEQTEEKQGS